MAKVIITLEDNPEGGVNCFATPNFAQMMEQKERKGITSAEGYALSMLLHQWKIKKEKGPIKLNLPRLVKNIFKK